MPNGKKTLSRVFSMMRGAMGLGPKITNLQLLRRVEKELLKEVGKGKRTPKKHGGPVKKYAKGGKVKK